VTIYAIDPGPHTGIFWIDEAMNYCRLTLDYTDEGWPPHHRPHMHLYRWLIQKVNPEEDEIICESFEFRKEDAQNREYIDYSTGEFVGVVKLYCQSTDTPHYMQTASEGKGFWDDDKLKRVGLWIPGKAERHVRDATRHWLHHVTFRQANNYYLEMLK